MGILHWIVGLFTPKPEPRHPPPYAYDFAAGYARIVAEEALEDQLFDEYLELPDRPQPVELMALYEGEPRDMEVHGYDHEHWLIWRAEAMRKRYIAEHQKDPDSLICTITRPREGAP